MILSLNEIEAAAGKAARGAGFSWGLAEEAAMAARWLAERGFDWLPALLDVLDGACAGEIAVEEGSIRSRTASAPVCPLAAGAYLADLGSRAVPMRLHHVRRPLYLLPFAARISARMNAPIAVDLGGAKLRLDGDAVHGVPADLAKLAAPVSDAALMLCAGKPGLDAACLRGGVNGRVVDDALWQRLAEWEARTYVAASTSSRLTGAGAGLTDND